MSRQFVDMSRIRIEGLLAAFPKLVGSGKQHTFVETENVRYVYQPMENLYLLLVTNKQSNILEDLETLRLLSKLVSFLADLCSTASFAECVDSHHTNAAASQTCMCWTRLAICLTFLCLFQVLVGPAVSCVQAEE